jgi:hypothetical protein
MKKIKPPVKKAAVWVDQETAYIFRIEGETEIPDEVIKSGVESRIRTKGEGKVSARFGNAFIDDQEKKQSRQRNQRKKYFNEIIEKIDDADYIYLFGPGRGKEELNNAIEKAHVFKGKVMAIEPADKITQNQMRAKVNEYFSRGVKPVVI